MNASEQYCSNPYCALRGEKGQGNIRLHDLKRQRYRCRNCKVTFTERTGTVLEGLRTEASLVMLVLTLLAWGCPVQAIVAAYGFDERTIAEWRERAGQHCQKVHQALIQVGQLDLQHVQADEIRAKLVGQIGWLAMAIMVPTRLWLGGVVQFSRDRGLIRQLLELVRSCAKSGQAVLVCTDGLAAYPKATLAAFRDKVAEPSASPKPGRPRLVVWPGLVIGRVIKRVRAKHLVEVERTIVRGQPAQVADLLCRSQGGVLLNTSFIERFNATLRQRLANLTRRSRYAAHKIETLSNGMYLVGSIYNWCVPHRELRQPNWDQPDQPRWKERTPAMASGLTDHIWNVAELLKYKVAPTPYVPPKRRGRPPNKLMQLFTL